MQFLRFLSDSRWEHNVQRAAQDSLWDGATLRPQGMDAAVGANRTKFYSAPSTDSLCNCCSTQLHLSTSASSFCRVAPGDICRFFHQTRWNHTDEKIYKDMKYYWSKPRCLWRSAEGKLWEDVYENKEDVQCKSQVSLLSHRAVPGVHVCGQSWLGTLSWIGTQTLKHV